ncbi:Aspartate aminotransferase [uncultured Eubacterium sp.]|nr:Aspartate aminotransferase [uncultured Eubacterium sp.]
MYNQTMYELGSQPSIIRELFAYGLQQAKVVGPENVFDYTLGNPSIPAPAKVQQAIKDIIDDTDSIKIHGYSMAGGFDETREAIAANLNKRFGTDIKASNLFVTCGAAPALISVIKTLAVDDQAEIMAVAPFFPEYRPFVNKNGANLIVVPADREHFQIDLAKVEELISEHTQAIIINSPNNPSGVVYTKETLEALAAILTKKGEEYGHPIYIVADEPYRELVYGDAKVTFIPTVYKNTIVCYSWSKSLSLPGERIGYVCVPDQCDDAANLYNGIAGAARAMGHVCAPTLPQMVIARCVDEMPDLKAYDENRTLLYDELTKMGYKCAKPDGAFYLFVEVPNGDGMAFCQKAKEDHNLLVVPGEGFDCPGYMRLSYCVSNAMIRRSLPAFQKMIDAYK